MLGEPAGAGDEECPSEAQISCLLDRALDDETAAAIEAHMDRCAACRALVAELVRFRSSSAGDEAEAPSPPEETAVLIAERYEIIEPVGSGGMGIVYLARDRRLARRVAIKMLRFGAESRSQAQLLKEAQTLARLCHPSIVVVHDVGTFEDQVFMAMEYVGGTSLRYWLERERPALPAVLSVFQQMADALAVAHQAGLVHQDFKPDNVLVGADGRARLSDFGLACTIVPGAAPDGGGERTRSGRRRALVGTPSYIAPELYRGAPPGPLSDQFAFAVTLYEALYGEHPFGELTRESAEREILKGRVREAPPGSAVPTWLRALVLQGLRTNPAERLPSMSLMSELLRRGEERSVEGWRRRVLRAVLREVSDRLRRYAT